MEGVAGDELLAAGEDLVVDAQAHGGCLLHAGDDGDDVVVERGAVIACLDFEDGESVAFVLERAVGDAVRTEELGAADFEPGEVVGMIDDAHHVGFGVAYAEFGAAFDHAASWAEKRAWAKLRASTCASGKTYVNERRSVAASRFRPGPG